VSKDTPYETGLKVYTLVYTVVRSYSAAFRCTEFF